MVESHCNRSRAGVAAALAATAMLAATACNPGSTAHTSRALIVDKSFDLKTADPHRELDATGAIVAKALYSTLLTFDGGDVATPVPSVASSYSSSEDARRFTFKLRPGVVFSDGAQLTSADVVFSLNRVINLKGRASSLLTGVSASAPDASTVVLELNDPDPSLPLLLTNPALAIVNSRAVKGHGGADGPGADKTDKAQDFLNSTSAGSGPYILKSFSALTDIELTANPRYWGPRPFFTSVDLHNVDAPAQLADIQSASDQVALDLSPAQAGTLTRNRSVVINAVAGPEVVFLFANQNANMWPVTPNKHFRNAVRYAIDYDALVQLMGAGAIQAAGVIPSPLLGALPAWVAPHRDLEKARAELAASGLEKPAVKLGFAADMAVSGLPMSALASLVRAELGDAGITVNLTGSPTPQATADYAAGTQQMGLWSVAAATADPDQFLDFLPGRSLGLRAGWQGGADPTLESFGLQVSTAGDAGARSQLFQEMQSQLNDDGPFFPLVQPGRVTVATSGLAGVDYNPSWSIDVAGVSATG